MTIRSGLALALLATLAPALVSRPAHACWDGIAASTPKVTLAIESAQTWSPEQARHWAKWIARIDALVPPGKILQVMHGDIEVCDETIEECELLDVTWDDGSAFTLFERTADIFATSGATIASARRMHRMPLTVQVAASHDLEAAERLADRINAAELDLSGFLEMGGFPSDHGAAHVVESYAGDMFAYHVVVGAFLQRDEAEAAAAALASELDLHGFVRPLEQSSISGEGC